MCQLMVKKGMYLDRVLSTVLVQGFSQEGRLELALDVFDKMRGDEGIELDAYAYTTMMGVFEYGYVDHSRELCEEMNERDMELSLVTYNVMIQWYCKSKWIGAAMELHNEMVRDSVTPDLRCYTILMTSLCKEGKLAEAKQLFNEMLEGGLFPDHDMFISIARFFPQS